MEGLGQNVRNTDDPGGRCQTDSNRSQQGQLHCPLDGAEAAPLGESGGAVLLEDGSGGEAAFLVEVI